MVTCTEVVQRIYPFKANNRIWTKQHIKAYLFCIAFILLLAIITSFVSGDESLTKHCESAHGKKDPQNVMFNQCYEDGKFNQVWLFFCTFHGMTFGDYYPMSSFERTMISLCMFLGYHFLVLTMALVLLSQLTGEKEPTLISTPIRILKAEWPSLILVLVILMILSPIVVSLEEGMSSEEDPNHLQFNNFGTGFYLLWCIFHKRPYGEVLPYTDAGKTVCAFVCLLGNLYQPYILALIAQRKPSLSEHLQLVDALRNETFDNSIFGSGYIVPGQEQEEEK